MTNNKRPIRTEAFVCYGDTIGESFCKEFLYSAEFTAKNLKQLVSGAHTLNKETLSEELARLVMDDDAEKRFSNCIMDHFVSQPRQWLSVRLGQRKSLDLSDKKLLKGSIVDLLTKLGEAGWYGPLAGSDDNQYFVRSVLLPFRQPGDSLDKPSGTLRWHVIAEAGKDYLALSWKGCTFTGLEPTITPAQFEYYKYIQIIFDELEELVGGKWEDIDLYDFVLDVLWDNYDEVKGFHWQDRRIRSDIDGVILSAYSQDAADSNSEAERDIQEGPPRVLDGAEKSMKGLRALSRRLAYGALRGVTDGEIGSISRGLLIKKMERNIRRELIHNAGTKSYEFSLDKIKEGSLKKRHLTIGDVKPMFRAHCYFGNSDAALLTKDERRLHRRKGYIDGASADCLRHMKCYANYGNSAGTLNFILKHIRESQEQK